MKSLKVIAEGPVMSISPALASSPAPEGASRLRLLTIALAPVGTVAAVALMLADRTGPPWLGISLLILLVITGVGQPIQWLAVGLGVVAALLHVLGFWASNSLTTDWLSASAGLSFLAVALFAEALGRECTREDQRRAETALRLEDLSPVDSVTGVTKWNHAVHTFERELTRSRRYRQPLALVMVGIENWAELRDALGATRSQRALNDVGKHLSAACRVIDVVAYKQDGEFGVLLPDTPPLGAEIVARRITSYVADIPDLRLRAGVTSFPTNPDTVDGLIEDALAGLSLAAHFGKAYLASVPSLSSSTDVADPPSAVSV